MQGETAKSMENSFSPDVDIEEDDEAIIVTMDIPGIDESNISIRVSGDYLIVKGARENEKEIKKKHTHQSERFYGMFERIIPLHVSVDTHSIKAEYHKGVLEIYLPKKPGQGHKEIPVRVK